MQCRRQIEKESWENLGKGALELEVCEEDNQKNWQKKKAY
jgi:hypothetical protein